MLSDHTIHHPHLIVAEMQPWIVIFSLPAYVLYQEECSCILLECPNLSVLKTHIHLRECVLKQLSNANKKLIIFIEPSTHTTPTSSSLPQSTALASPSYNTTHSLTIATLPSCETSPTLPNECLPSSTPTIIRTIHSYHRHQTPHTHTTDTTPTSSSLPQSNFLPTALASS